MKKTRSEIQKTIDAIRDEWQSYPRKHAAIDKRKKRVQMPDGRWKTLIQCCSCSGLFPREDIEADHINPVGPLLSTKAEDVDAYRQALLHKLIAGRVSPDPRRTHATATVWGRPSLVKRLSSAARICNSAT